jgi:uncharacterized protein with PQ loop repeat
LKVSNKQKMTLLDLLGTLGSLCLGISGTPQAIKVFREGKAPGISWTFLCLLLTGFATMIIFTSLHDPPLIPLLIGYSINFSSYAIILFFKLFARKEQSNA